MFGDIAARGMTVTSGSVVIQKDDSNLIGISIGGGAPLCPCLYVVQVREFGGVFLQSSSSSYLLLYLSAPKRPDGPLFGTPTQKHEARSKIQKAADMFSTHLSTVCVQVVTLVSDISVLDMIRSYLCKRFQCVEINKKPIGSWSRNWRHAARNYTGTTSF